MFFGRRICPILVLLTVMIVGRAGAEYILPEALLEIEEEAFAGNGLIHQLRIPEGVTSIGARAFAECAGLNRVVIPASVTFIGEEAFDRCGEALLIECAPGSAAVSYARSFWKDYRADTVCRALAIGQTYEGTQLELQGSANDRAAVSACLLQMGWTVSQGDNLSADNILDRIQSSFADAAENDISLFYYSGHGLEDGSLLGGDGEESLTPARLRSALDRIPGRKVVIVDACCSGQLIAKAGTMSVPSPSAQEAEKSGSNSQSDGGAGFVAAFQAAFSQTRLRGALNADSYFVLTAARGNEISEEGPAGGEAGPWFGYFTNALCQGLGYDCGTMSTASRKADMNGDQAVSIQECFLWAYHQALRSNPSQHADVWPSGCGWFAPFRFHP